MDRELLVVLLCIGAGVFFAIAVWLWAQYRQHKLMQRAAQWLLVEATIESGNLEGTRETSKVLLPTFAFSYKVSDQYYSGRFSLRAYLPTSQLESLIGQMIGRKMLVRYDPQRPEAWFIPEESIDGYKVEQKLGSHIIHDYSPSE